MHLRQSVAFAFLGFCWGSPVPAADISYAPSLHALFLRGAITSGDAESLRAAYDGATEKPSAIYLSSPGGDFYAAIAIGNWVRDKGLDAYAGLLCDSACAYLWLGGVNRFANNIIGVHAPYVRTSTVTVAVPAEGLMDVAWYLARLGYERALLDAIFVVGTTESNECFPITGPETRYLGIGYNHFAEAPYKAELDALRAAAARAADP